MRLLYRRGRLEPFGHKFHAYLTGGASTSGDITKVATACSIYPKVLSLEWPLPCLSPLNDNPNLSLSVTILSKIFCSLHYTSAMSAVSSAYLILFMFSLFIQIPSMSLTSFPGHVFKQIVTAQVWAFIMKIIFEPWKF